MIFSGKKPYFADYFRKMAKNKNEETGIILKIQKQTGCLLIVIGAAMLAFVLTDLLKSGPSVFSGSQNVIGEIAGDKIAYEDFSRKVDELKQFYIQDLGGNGEDEQFRDMAWNQLIVDKIEKKEHRILGIEVGSEEFKDLTTGLHPDESIIQAFQDQETKQFNRNQLINFLEVQMQEDERKYRVWFNYYEVPLRERIEREKYNKLVKSGMYVTKLDAKANFDREHLEVGAVSVGLPYSTISDSTISYTDSDLQAYIKKNSKKYQQLASRDIDFVVINVFPDASDTLRTKEWAEEAVVKFKATKKDSIFIRSNRSIIPYDGTYKRRGSFPPDVEDLLFAADTGAVIGPIYENGAYSLYKVNGIDSDSLSTMRARHILLPLTDASNEADGLAKARTMMAQVRSGAKSFDESAQNNYDGTGANKGDLGWISEEGSSNVPEDVLKEIFKRNAGDWFVAASTRGYHIVNITQGKTNKIIRVAVASQKIVPGNKADQIASRKAADIQYQANENDDFMAVVEEKDQRVREGTKITIDNPVIPGVSNTREIVRWLYDSKTEVGSISDVIDMQDRYVVAKVRAIREDGTAKLDDIRELVISHFVQSEKGDILGKQLEEALVGSQDAEAVAKKLNTVVQQIPALTMFAPQLTGLGTEPVIQGTIFGLPEGKYSKPMKGETGVYVVWNLGRVSTIDIPFVEEEAKALLSTQTEQIADALVIEALKSKGVIVDNRYRFY